MKNKSLINQQVIIVLYLLAGAISCIEATLEFKKGGFSNPTFYFFAAIFVVCVIMYFIRKKQRFESRLKEKENNS